MTSENPNTVLSKGTVLHPQNDQEVAAAMAEHVHYLNSWLDSRLKYMAVTLEIAEEEALESDNIECQRLIASVRHELRLTEKLVVPVAAFANAEGGYSPQPPVRMAAALAQTRAEWVDFLIAATTQPTD